MERTRTTTASPIRIAFQHDFSGADDTNASDTDNHGSNVASIVGSQDAIHTGMAPGVDLIILKVFPDGTDTTASGT